MHVPPPPTPGSLDRGLPFLPARRRTVRTAQILLSALAVAVLIALGLVLLSFITGSTGSMGFVVGVGLAVVPAVAVVGAYLWVDRFEPEPTVLLAGVFAYGAIVAALASAIINSVSSAVIASSGAGAQDASTTTAVLVAPVVEEAAKGSVILGIALFFRREFDGVLDGIVLAGFVGVGFAFTENILYFGRAFLSGAETGIGSGLFAAGVTFVARGVMGPFAHPLFTTCTGIGLGIAVSTRFGVLRLLAPVVGYVAAVLLHGSWNLAATGGTSGWLSTYVVLFIPLFVLAFLLVTWVRRREGRLIARQLPAYVASGWLPSYDVGMVASLAGRRQARAWASERLGRDGERAMVDYQLAATELAFLRERAGRRGPDERFAARERALLEALGRSRRPFAALR